MLKKFVFFERHDRHDLFKLGDSDPKMLIQYFSHGYLLITPSRLLSHERRLGGLMSFSSAYPLREKWADKFESGIGGTLKERFLGLFT